MKNSFKVKEFDQKQQWVGSAIYCKRIGNYIEAANRFEKANPDIPANTFLHQLYDEITCTTPIEDEILERAITFYKKQKIQKIILFIAIQKI